MKRAAIALVSDQRIQNLIPLFQQGRSYTHLVLVLSRERATGVPAERYQQAAQHIGRVAEQLGVHVEQYDCFVDPFKIEDSEETIAKCIATLGPNDEVSLNFTGGTKPMAIGALRAARGLSRRAVYVNTEDNELLWIEPDGTLRSETIRVDGLGLDQYVTAYGEAISSRTTVSQIDPDEVEWAEIIARHHSVIYRRVVQRLNQRTKQAWKDKAGYPISLSIRPTRREEAVIEQLEETGLWNWDRSRSGLSIPDPSKAGFLNGRWVEVYTAAHLDAAGCFDEVAINVTPEGIEGEIDAAVIANGRLALFECKSNVKQSQQLAKLDSFRKNLGGPYALAFYVRASSAYRRQVVSQASKWRINHVFMGADIETLDQVVMEWMELAL